MTKYQSRRQFWERISNGLLFVVVGIFVVSAILSVTGLPDRSGWPQLGAQVSGATPPPTAATSAATSEESAWYESVWEQVSSVFSVVDETRNRIMAGDMFRITQIGAASATAVQNALERQLPAANLYRVSAALQPARDPIDGTLLINTPLQVANTLTVQGSSTLATTTVNGTLSAAAAAFGLATIDGRVTAGGVTTGAVDASGVTAGTVSATTVTGDTIEGTSITTADLQVTNLMSLAALEVSGNSRLGTVSIASSTEVAGVVRALGGLTTAGADVDLEGGELFAANVVNQVRAGENVTIEGTRNEPIISVDTDDLVGVLSVDGETGEVELDEGVDIRISNLRISNTSRLSSVRARGGCTDCITDSDTRNNLTISGGLIENTPIGSSSPNTGRFTSLRVGSSTATSTPLTVAGNATSTFVGSIDISSGCFAIGGTCIGGAAATNYVQLNDTPSSLLAGALQFTDAAGTALTQSAQLVFDGSNLGVGTSTPETPLSVVGTTTIDGTLQVRSATSSQFSGGINVTNGCVAVDGTCIGGITSIDGLTDVSVASATSGDLFSFDGSAWRNVATSTLGLGDGTFIGLSDTPSGYSANALLYANSAGTGLLQSGQLVFDGSRLAVGTSSPRTALTVAGAMSVLDRSVIRYYDETNSEYVGLRAASGLATTTVWNLPAADGTSNQLLVTDGNGNLRFDDVTSIGGGASNYVELLDTPSAYVAGALQFANTAGTALEQDSNLNYRNGFLGIGVAAPTERLVTDGTVRFLGSGNLTGFVYDYATNQVGIGASTTAARLTVQNGSILQRGGTGSDFYVPKLLSAIDLPARANDLYVRGIYAYVVTNSAANEFHVINIANPNSPFVQTGISLPSDVNAIDVQGSYAYVVSNATGDDFHVIDISDPLNPAEVSSVNLVTDANDVVVRGRFAYVGSGAAGDDFHVIDISNPLNPVEVGSINLADGVNGVTVQGNYAFAATTLQGDDFHVIDISNPTALVEVDSLNLPDTAYDVAVRDSYAYVVTGASGNDVHVIDIGDPTAVAEVGGLDMVTSMSSITLAGSYAYVTSFGANDDVHVIDISDPTSPLETGGVDLASGDALSVQLVGSYAYVTSSNAGDGFHVVDVSGLQAQSALINSLRAGTLAIDGNANVAGRITADLGLYVGTEGIKSGGILTVTDSGDSSFAGRLAVGTTTVSSELTVDGTINATNLLGGATGLSTDANGNIIRDPSDRRLKTDIRPIEDALAVVLNLQGVRYEWRDTERFGTQTEVGFIAQDVYSVLPEVVRTGGDYWSLNTRNITAVLVESIKEIWETVRGNQTKIQTLEERVQILEAEINTTTSPSGTPEDETNQPPEETPPVEDGNDSDDPAPDPTDEDAPDQDETESDDGGVDDLTTDTTTGTTTEADGEDGGIDDSVADDGTASDPDNVEEEEDAAEPPALEEEEQPNPANLPPETDANEPPETELPVETPASSTDNGA